MLLKRLVAAAVLLLVATSLVSVVGCTASGESRAGLGNPVATSGSANLYKAGQYNVAVLRGNYLEMGRQYGTLLRSQIKAMYSKAADVFNGLMPQFKPGMNLDKVEAFCLSQCRRYPKRLRDVMRGIQETAGLEPAQLALIDQCVIGYAMLAIEALPGIHCSSVTAWGAYTGNGPVVMGRHFDFPPQYIEFNPYLSVIVFNPDDGSIPTATLAYAGQTGCIQFFNKSGLVVETDDMSAVVPPNNKMYTDRIPVTAVLHGFGLDNANLNELNAAFMTMRFQYPLICNVASPQRGQTYEVGTTDVVRRNDTADGLAVIANTPLDPHWNMPPAEDASDVRQQNLIDLANKEKGHIDVATMKKIFDVTKSDGGAFVTPRDNANPADSITCYKFVYQPSTRDLSVRVPSAKDWTRIRLAPCFAGSPG